MPGEAMEDAVYLGREHEDYPEPLRHIPDPPAGLWRRGAHRLRPPAVAVVGTRRPTHYGLTVARMLGAELARLGLCVVSGMARGVDTAAHEGALEAGGATVAVLGTGIDLVYPPENAGLCRRIAESGAVFSELPRGCRADKSTFPQRNRIVSGLSAAVVVVESDVTGGAMITARLAGDQGRVVAAVPGRIDQPTSAGCHRLLRDGALLLSSVDDLLDELSYLGGPAPSAARPRPRDAPPPAGPDEAALLDCLRGGEILSSDQLAARAGLPAPRVAAALMLLEIKRRASRRLDGRYEEV